MKKRVICFLALLLCALMLCSCARQSMPATLQDSLAHLAEQREERGEDEPILDMLPFSQMVYERPSTEELQRLIDLAEEALYGGKSYSVVEPLLDDCFLYYYHYSTMCTLADIRSCLDLTDEYYAEEYEWCAENYALVSQAMDGLFYACAGSALGAQLERDYFWEGFCEQYSDESESIYSDTMVELMQEESSLISEYRSLTADPTIEYRGKEEKLYDLLDHLSGSAYNNAVIAYYTQYNERFADLFIRLVTVREKQAEEMGYDSFEEMQYVYAYERDYTPEQAQRYLEDIRRCIAPLYEDLLESPVLGELWYSRVSQQKLHELIGGAAAEIGGDVAEAYEFMMDYELCDTSVDSRKAQMSFEIYLDEYDAPYVFLNAGGDTDDILSFAHEFGHFCDAYVNTDAYETVDLAEIYSQGMEFLMLSRLGAQLDDDEVRNIARLKMIDTVEMYVEQASFAQFEHEIYALGSENLSAETINGISRQVAQDYGYYYEEYDPFYSLGWVDIVHYFEQPFYVISYPVSNDVAMQIYELELDGAGRGLERYLEVLERDYSGMMDLVEAGGFEDPFSAGRMEKIASLARRVLGVY